MTARFGDCATSSGAGTPGSVILGKLKRSPV